MRWDNCTRTSAVLYSQLDGRSASPLNAIYHRATGPSALSAFGAKISVVLGATGQQCAIFTCINGQRFSMVVDLTLRVFLTGTEGPMIYVQGEGIGIGSYSGRRLRRHLVKMASVQHHPSVATSLSGPWWSRGSQRLFPIELFRCECHRTKQQQTYWVIANMAKSPDDSNEAHKRTSTKNIPHPGAMCWATKIIDVRLMPCSIIGVDS
ncbi:hypothetical protein PGTUg99_031492 [Puccinia graminis f. sp. tritici]|uniref:Uncharacterized protein n=1 Tax=Puccinia graminis f. sp. tritici TaxID=56615 RepID=A0A5B0RPR0_PUCGR|nr:hypothetical protein PGTUg99_031492 [Puccinia graminis f. sp. tritici]